jgi:hypothetical protein
MRFPPLRFWLWLLLLLLPREVPVSSLIFGTSNSASPRPCDRSSVTRRIGRSSTPLEQRIRL